MQDLSRYLLVAVGLTFLGATAPALRWRCRAAHILTVSVENERESIAARFPTSKPSHQGLKARLGRAFTRNDVRGQLQRFQPREDIRHIPVR